VDNKEVEIKEGVVIESLPNAMYRVKLDNSEDTVLGLVSGKMRLHHIKILPGDKVKMEFTKYDKDRGRIVFRSK